MPRTVVGNINRPSPQQGQGQNQNQQQQKTDVTGMTSGQRETTDIAGGLYGAAASQFGKGVAKYTGASEIPGAEKVFSSVFGGAGQGSVEAGAEAEVGYQKGGVAGAIKNLHPDTIFSKAMQGAAWGALPQVTEQNGVARGLQNFGLHLLAGGSTKAIDNIGMHKEMSDHVLQSGALTATFAAGSDLAFSGARGILSKISDKLYGHTDVTAFVGQQHATDPEVKDLLDFTDPLKSVDNLRKAAMDKTKSLTDLLPQEQQQVTNKAATSWIGGAQASNPEVTQHIDYTKPLESVDNLKKAAQDIYQPLQQELKKSSQSVVSFLGNITEGGKTTFDDKELKAVNNALIDAANATDNPETKQMLNDVIDASKGQTIKSRSGTVQKVDKKNISEFFNELTSGTEQNKPIKMTMDVANAFKKRLGDELEDPASSTLYTRAKRFIEENVSDNVNAQEINQKYNSLREAGQNLTNQIKKKGESALTEEAQKMIDTGISSHPTNQTAQKFNDAADYLQKTIDKEKDYNTVHFGKPFNFQNRIGLLVGASMAGGALGFKAGGSYGGLSGAALGAGMMYSGQMDTTAKASNMMPLMDKAAEVTGDAAATVPGVSQATNQIVSRLTPQITKIIQQLFGGNKQNQDQQQQGQ